MKTDFNKVMTRNNISNATDVFNRMSELKSALETQPTMAANFNGQAKFEEAKKGDDMVSNFVFNMIMFNPITACLSAKFAIFGAFNTAASMPYMEGLNVVAQDIQQGSKGKLYDYPEGRKAFKIASGRPEKKYEVATPEVAKPKKSDDKFARQDKKAMYDMLEMMRKLEKKSARMTVAEEKGRKAFLKSDKKARSFSEMMRPYADYMSIAA